MSDPVGSFVNAPGAALDAAAAGLRERAGTGGSAIVIAGKLRRAITDGAYAHGDRLPPERELAMTLGSSRTTVRAALQQLEMERMVARKVGRGTFVVYGDSSDDSDIASITSPLELIEVRLAVEPRMVRLAVLHATSRDLDRIGEALAEAERAGADQDHFTRWDQSFHVSLAMATRNPLMVWICRQINHVRGHNQWRVMKEKILTKDRIAAYNAEHRALFEAIRTRDGDRAVALITAHLNDAHRDLVGANAS
jgi:DNA-binding FadR family transcriptional regulator